MKEQLKLAIQYLRRRAVSTEEVNDELLKQCNKVIPIFEVESVLEMVQNGQFTNFYNRMKEQGHTDFVAPKNA